MKQHLATWTIILLVSLVPMAPSAGRQVAAQAEAPGQASTATAKGPTEVNDQYEAYGFLFEQYDDHDTYGRFTEGQMEVLGSVIVAFADLVGGPQALSVLVNGPVRVRRDLQAVVSYTQAGKVIGLGRGAFDLAVSTESNYYTWGAHSGDELAQIVFGHEIGHRWLQSLRERKGKDWSDVYEHNVWRGERISSRETWADANQVDCEEEAVTNLALFVLGTGYRWTFLHDAPATENRQVWIDGWVHDLIANG